MTPEDIRAAATAGVELPARVIVRSSKATPGDGYVATVEVLDGAGEPTKQVLRDVPLDPLIQTEDGTGIFAPPKTGRIMALVWAGGVAGHPIVAAGAWTMPAKPRLAVPAGEHSHQGETFDVRMLPDEWKVSDEAGTELSGKGERWRMASPDDDLLSALVAFGEAVRDGLTVFDTDTPSGSTGNQLGLNAGTKTAINSALDRVRAVLRS